MLPNVGTDSASRSLSVSSCPQQSSIADTDTFRVVQVFSARRSMKLYSQEMAQGISPRRWLLSSVPTMLDQEPEVHSQTHRLLHAYTHCDALTHRYIHFTCLKINCSQISHYAKPQKPLDHLEQVYLLSVDTYSAMTHNFVSQHRELMHSPTFRLTKTHTNLNSYE